MGTDQDSERLIIRITTVDGELLDIVETTRGELAHEQWLHPSGLLAQVQA